MLLLFFFFNDTATTEIYTLSLHDALPICGRVNDAHLAPPTHGKDDPSSAIILEKSSRPLKSITQRTRRKRERDRKSTRLNSSHANISYAVFCLKKKKKIKIYKTRLVDESY